MTKRLAKVVPISRAQPMAPPEPVLVPLLLSEADRWLVTGVLRGMKWGGGEGTIMALSKIHAVLRLGEVNLGKAWNKCNRSAQKYTLSVGESEVLIAAMCSVGVQGEVGPVVAQVVARLRGMINKAKASS